MFMYLFLTALLASCVSYAAYKTFWQIHRPKGLDGWIAAGIVAVGLGWATYDAWLWCIRHSNPPWGFEMDAFWVIFWLATILSTIGGILFTRFLLKPKR